MKSRGPEVRWYFILACCAILHAAFILYALKGVMPVRLPDWWYYHETWVALASLWLLWPVVLGLHRGRSWWSFSLAMLISLLLLLPSIGFYRLVAPEAFGFSRMPTPDKPNIVGEKDLGGGFRRVAMEEFISGGFESIYHGEYLFFRSRRLGDFVSSSVAPSRKLAAYVEDDLQSPIRDDHFGFQVFLFRASDQKSIQLTQELQYDWNGFEWDESAGYLILQHRHAAPERFSLPKT